MQLQRVYSLRTSHSGDMIAMLRCFAWPAWWAPWRWFRRAQKPTAIGVGVRALPSSARMEALDACTRGCTLSIGEVGRTACSDKGIGAGGGQRDGSGMGAGRWLTLSLYYLFLLSVRCFSACSTIFSSSCNPCDTFSSTTIERDYTTGRPVPVNKHLSSHLPCRCRTFRFLISSKRSRALFVPIDTTLSPNSSTSSSLVGTKYGSCAPVQQVAATNTPNITLNNNNSNAPGRGPPSS